MGGCRIGEEREVMILAVMLKVLWSVMRREVCYWRIAIKWRTYPLTRSVSLPCLCEDLTELLFHAVLLNVLCVVYVFYIGTNETRAVCDVRSCCCFNCLHAVHFRDTCLCVCVIMCVYCASKFEYVLR